ncbi:L-2-hydroxyglutarate dehydrogenase, mitochondrial [Anabrus simplex]|uniref:L-2-hydroxyglutarate dehydrogenase, mitochondrial n=1 Tax=Anabrus simplex TaxID=316456 RepID=UPI0035A3A607
MSGRNLCTVLISRLPESCTGDIRMKGGFIRNSSSSSNLNYDAVIIGGGIVGMATARELQKRHPQWKMAVVEKEDHLACHQSRHNSGVIHAGIYYKPGSLKAKLCVEGMGLAYKYLEKKNIPYKKCGQLIVATNKIENDRLDELIERGEKNNVPDLKVVDGAGIKKIEPYCQGVRALWSPHTGIVDWGNVTEYFGKDFTEGGGKIFFNYEVVDFKRNTTGSEAEMKQYPVCVVGKKETVNANCAVVCGGLHSDHLARLSGGSSEPRIVPVRGEYVLLNPAKNHLVKGNIYPVPDPRHFPFLGVHFTPRIDGSVWLGPNAVLAFKREGYNGPSGVRAQALDRQGQFLEDFVFDIGNSDEISRRVLHCRNAPSPAATSSLAIARMIADRVEKEFNI